LKATDSNVEERRFIKATSAAGEHLSFNFDYRAFSIRDVRWARKLAFMYPCPGIDPIKPTQVS